MHRVVLLAVACLLHCRCTFAQVTAEILLDQEQYIPGEDVEISVRIVNRSGEALKLGTDPDWLTFAVEGNGRDAFVVKTGDVPVLGEFTLNSAKMATKTVQITPYFSFTQPGRYRIIATVRIPGWDKAVVSLPKTLQVGGGTELWEREFGMPRVGKEGAGPPDVRKYALVKSTRLNQLAMYVRITDSSESFLYKVTAIGPLVSFSRPEAQLDQFNNLHVLWQNGARTYCYAAVNPDGQLFVRQTYEFEKVRPELAVLEETGRLHVIGGQRRKSAADIPPE